MNQQSIPQQRVMDKLNRLLEAQDPEGAERHLLYWMREAESIGDLRGQLMLNNELIGHYRKAGRGDEALAAADRALRLLDELDFSGTLTSGTTYVNAATACSAFGEPERAMQLFEKARAVYEALPNTPRHLLGGLYNNMAVTCRDLGRYEEAYGLFDRAMAMMAEVPGGTLEQAITCLNRADTIALECGTEEGEERINALLEQASAFLADPAAPRNEYYAFVCEKCAPGFSYYGWFLEAEELEKEAKQIRERLGAVEGVL
jgi:tetratricopeptide (TPR) repeat protein